MSLLTDTDIRKLLDTRTLIIKPFVEARLTPVGYNLSVGDFYVSKRELRRVDLPEGHHFTVRPGESVAICTLEDVELPKDRTLSALLLSKVKMIKAGFAPISSTIDSDHSGRMVIIVQNISSHEAVLVHGQPFCTMVLLKNISPSAKEAKNEYDNGEIVRDLLDDLVRSA